LACPDFEFFCSGAEGSYVGEVGEIEEGDNRLGISDRSSQAIKARTVSEAGRITTTDLGSGVRSGLNAGLATDMLPPGLRKTGPGRTQLEKVDKERSTGALEAVGAGNAE
jgi:hypothetical protein